MTFSKRTSSWLEDVALRARRESEARSAYEDLSHRRVQRKSGPFDVYQASVDVPGYATRQVTIEFDRKSPSHPKIYVDGPTDSPHRFRDRGRTRLCIWYSGDSDDQIWVPDDGLLVLLGMVAEHLFKESWWRERGVWLGAEMPHGELNGDPNDQTSGKD